MEQHEIWLARARSALELAKTRPLPLMYYEDLCFQAQQAAEKALKGLLIYYKEEPEFTHTIERLFVALSKYTAIPDDIRKASNLTNYAVFTRYPGAYDDVTKENYEESIIIASACLEWVASKIKENN